MFYFDFDKIVNLLIFILKISFLTKLLKNFLTTIIIKTNKMKNNNNNNRINRIKLSLKISKIY